MLKDEFLAKITGGESGEELVLLENSWKYKNRGYESYCDLFGVNIFDYGWNSTGEKIMLPHPDYPNQTHIFRVYTADINGTMQKFAAGEVSMCAWIFYLEE